MKPLLFALVILACPAIALRGDSDTSIVSDDPLAELDAMLAGRQGDERALQLVKQARNERARLMKTAEIAFSDNQKLRQQITDERVEHSRILIRMQREAAAIPDPFATVGSGSPVEPDPFSAVKGTLRAHDSALTQGSSSSRDERQWTVIDRFEGSGDTQTRRFVVGAEWRVRWGFVVPSSEDEGWLSAHAFGTGSSLSIVSESQPSGTWSGESYGSDAGTYQIRVSCYDARWRLIVEELR